jgi:cytochrome c biogenesis protein CcmG, thiol:disulfide interchange protein DsbE
VTAMRRSGPAYLFLAVLSVACSRSDAVSTVTRIDKPLPALSGELVQGGSFDPSVLKGKIAIIPFWGTWCGPCRREMPALQQVWSEFGDRGVVVLGIDSRELDAAAPRTFLDEFGVTFPSIDDRAGAFAYSFGFPYLPVTYVVDGSGTMRYRLFGAVTSDQLGRIISELQNPG